MLFGADGQGLEGSTCPGGIYHPKLTLPDCRGLMLCSSMLAGEDVPVPQLQELSAFALAPAPSAVQPQALREEPGCRQKLPLGHGASGKEQYLLNVLQQGWPEPMCQHLKNS